MGRHRLHVSVLAPDDNCRVDDAVLRRARTGDADALGTLLTAVRPLVLRVAKRGLTVDVDVAHDAAEDVAQETLLRVARHIGECDAATPGRFFAWVLAIARRLILDARRVPFSDVSSRRASLDPVDHSPSSRSWRSGHTAHGALVDEVEPEPRLSTPAELLVALSLRAYSRLPEQAALLVWWRVVAGASWAEIGRGIGTTPAGAKRRYQRAQARIHGCVLTEVSRLPEPTRSHVVARLAVWEHDEAGSER